MPRAASLQQQKPPQQEACPPQLESSLCSLQVQSGHRKQGTPSTARKKKKKNQVLSYNYTTELTQWGQWSCRRLPRAWMLQSAPAPQPLDSICRPIAAVPPGTQTRSLLSPPPPPGWTQHGPGFFLSPASRSKPRAHTLS